MLVVDCRRRQGRLREIPSDVPRTYRGARQVQLHVRAHRLAYQLQHGVAVVTKLVLHTCDNPRCVRPSHLFLGTQLDNRRDCKKKGRTAHPDLRGENHNQARLSWADVREIRKTYARGGYGAGPKLARRFKISTHHVYGIAHGKSWKEGR